MKIIQVVPFIGKEASGPAYSVPNLCRALKGCGQSVELHVMSPTPQYVNDLNVKSYRRHNFPHSSLGRCPEKLIGLKEACQDADIIHNNSLWMMSNIYPLKAIKNTKCKLVISPRGTLASWALNRRKWQKKFIGHFLGQYENLKRADMFHATCEKEYYEIRNFGLKQPVAIIPIGMDLLNIEQQKNDRRKMLFLGRLHPVKAIDRLLEAWAMLEKNFLDWDFQIVGPNSELKKQLEDTVTKQKISRVEFIDEQNGLDKFRFYSSADLYVLPSFTENFGITVAEALASNTPVLASKTTPWAGLETNKCGWISDNSPAALAEKLSEILSMSRTTLEGYGARGKDWMQRDFSWESVGDKTLKAYQWLCGKIEKTDYIKLK